MRKGLNNLVKFSILSVFILCNNVMFAQHGVYMTVQNLAQTAPNKLEWDAYLIDNGNVSPDTLSLIQHGFLINTAIFNSGTPTYLYNNTGSGIASPLQFTSPISTIAGTGAFAGQTVIRVTGPSSPGCCSASPTIIGTTGLGTFITHYTITNSVPFAANSTPNLSWTGTSGYPYATRIAEYWGLCGGTCLSTQITMTPGINAIVVGNPLLNPSPSTQASEITFSCPTSSILGVSWTNGNGVKRAVFAKAGTGVITDPINFTTYTASSDWNVPGTQLGTSGYYCVYNDNGSSFTLTNMVPGTTYTFQVYEYLGGAGSEVYNITTATNNPNTQATTTGITWLGTTSTDWSVGSNWSSGVPGGTDNIYISPLTTNQPHVTAATGNPAQCNAINICSGAILTIDPGKALTAYGNTTNNGTFIINSDENGTGSFIDNGTVTGNVNVKQYLPTGRWWYIGTPVSGTTGADAFGALSIVPSSGTRALYWNEPLHNYGDVTDSYTLLPMQGYSFQDFVAPRTANYVGALNTGLKNASLTRTSGYKEGFNLVCNPYPSAINFDIAHVGITPSNNIEPTLWYKTSSVFATYNFSNGLDANGGLPVIPAMQAFWVRVATGTSGSLQVDNTARTHSSNDFYKLLNTTNVFRMQTTDGTTNDEMVVAFINGAQNIFENNDSRKMSIDNATFPQIFSLTTDAIETSINGQTELLPNEDRIVPVGFTTYNPGTFSFNATNLNDFDASISVHLEDLQTSVMQDLRQTPDYSFTSGIVNDANRFKLHFSNTATNIASSTTDEVMAYVNHNTIYVNIPTTGTGFIELYDMVGNKILSKLSVQGLSVVQTNVSDGIYMVKVHTDFGLVTKKSIDQQVETKLKIQTMRNIQRSQQPQKKNYIKPQIVRIVLDNQISMVMQSTPPGDPDGMIQPEHFSINPFKLMKL